jgi:hypothetical protein
MILVERDSDTIWWVKEETLPSVTFKIKKAGGIPFAPTFKRTESNLKIHESLF